jgi:DNA-binding protein H-NS
MPSLNGMDVQALMNLRTQIDRRLAELRTELEKQLDALIGQAKPKRKASLKGRKVPPKYKSPQGQTWAGRGAKPLWLVAAMKKGRKMEDFLIKRRRG